MADKKVARTVRCAKCKGIRNMTKKNGMDYYYCSSCGDYIPVSLTKKVATMSTEKVPSKYTFNDKGQISGWRSTDEGKGKK